MDPEDSGPQDTGFGTDFGPSQDTGRPALGAQGNYICGHRFDDDDMSNRARTQECRVCSFTTMLLRIEQSARLSFMINRIKTHMTRSYNERYTLALDNGQLEEAERIRAEKDRLRDRCRNFQTQARRARREWVDERYFRWGPDTDREEEIRTGARAMIRAKIAEDEEDDLEAWGQRLFTAP
ncbi:MAG: hypothetical protein M1816_001945 [Peltula sp. TS41687]|nr:MAG: hypothetical protein M1816_001945 [Peltula sp. TS41687]